MPARAWPKPRWALASILAAAVLWALVATLGYAQRTSPGRMAAVRVPAVVGWRLGAARSQLNLDGLDLRVGERSDGWLHSGKLVIGQQPGNGAVVPSGTVVSVSVLRHGIAVWRRRINTAKVHGAGLRAPVAAPSGGV